MIWLLANAGGPRTNTSREIGVAAILDPLRAPAAPDAVGRFRCMGAIQCGRGCRAPQWGVAHAAPLEP